MIRTAVLTSASLFLGMVLGALVAPGLLRSPRLDPSPAIHEKEPTPQETVAASPARAARPSWVTLTSGTAQLPAAADKRLEEALRAIPVPEYKEGTAAVSGQVRTRDGTPLSGVLIRATGSRLWDNESLKRDRLSPPETDLLKVVLDSVAEHYRKKAATKEAVTEEDGTYVITGLLADERYTVRGYKKGWIIDTAPGHRHNDEPPGRIIDFVAEPVVTLPVAVKLPDGTAPYKASIEWTNYSGDGEHRGSEPWYPEDPVIQLTPAAYALTAKAGDSYEYTSDTQEISIEAGDEPPELVFQVKTRPGIRGTLVFTSGEEPERAFVHLLGHQGGSPPDPELIRTAGRSAWVFRGERFEFTFKDLAPGTYIVGASRNRQRLLVNDTVEVSEDLVTKNLVIPALAPGEYTVLRAFGPDGQVLSGVKVSATFRSGGGSSLTSPSIIKKNDGYFWVVLDLADSTELREHDVCSINVYSKEYGSERVEFSPLQVSEVSVQFQEPARLSVTVSGYMGSGYEGLLWLSLRKLENDQATCGRRGYSSVLSRSRRSVFSRSRRTSGQDFDLHGRQSFGPLEPGAYEVVLMLRVGRQTYRARAVESVPIALQTGDNNASISIPPLYSLTVQPRDVRGASSVVLRSITPGVEHWSDRQTFDDGSDQVTFGLLPAGEYKVYLLGAGQTGQMVVQVPAQSLVRF